MIHEILIVGPLQCNCSILGDEASREAIVVDPGDDISRIVSTLEEHQLTVKQIIVTHAHIDHIAGAQRLKRLTGAPIFYNQNDLPLVNMMDIQAGWLGIATPEVAPPDASLEDGQVISITGLTGSILHTPGHTEGSVCLYLPSNPSCSPEIPSSPAPSDAPTCPEATPKSSSNRFTILFLPSPTTSPSSPAMVQTLPSESNESRIHFFNKSIG